MTDETPATTPPSTPAASEPTPEAASATATAVENPAGDPAPHEHEHEGGTAAAATTTTADGDKKEQEKLHQTVEMKDVGPCKKHIKVIVERADVDKRLNEKFSELVKDANVPGFRPGKAPRRVV